MTSIRARSTGLSPRASGLRDLHVGIDGRAQGSDGAHHGGLRNLMWATGSWPSRSAGAVCCSSPRSAFDVALLEL